MFKKIISILLAVVVVFPMFGVYANAIELNSDFVDASKPIPSDAVYYSGHYYKVYQTNKTWEGAKIYCESLGGHLATISSAAENKFLYDYIKSKGISSCYFGLKKQNGVWTWVTNEKFDYNNWASGEPNNEYGNEYYGMFYYKNTYTWNDGGPSTLDASSNSCTFLCEWDTTKFNSDVFMTKDQYIKAHLNFLDTENYKYMKLEDYKESLRYAPILSNEYEGLKTGTANVWKYMSFNFVDNLLDNEYEVLLTDFLIDQSVYDEYEKKFNDLTLKKQRSLLFDIVNILEKNWKDKTVVFERSKTIDILLENIDEEGNEQYFEILYTTIKSNQYELNEVYKKASNYNFAINTTLNVIKEVMNGVKEVSAVYAYRETSNEFKSILSDVRKEILASEYTSNELKLANTIQKFLDMDEDEAVYKQIAESSREGKLKAGFKVLWSQQAKDWMVGLLKAAGLADDVATTWVSGITIGYHIGMLLNKLITNNDDITNNILLIKANGTFEKYVFKVLEKYENNLKEKPTYENAVLFDRCYKLFNEIQIYALDKYIDNLNNAQDDLIHMSLNLGRKGNVQEINEVSGYKSELEQILCHDHQRIVYEDLETIDEESVDYNISFNKDNIILNNYQQTEQLKIIFSDDRYNYDDIQWKSGNTYVATVDDNGVVTANNNGITTISATLNTTYGQKVAICNVKVDMDANLMVLSNDENKGIVSQSITENIKVGDTITIKASPNEGYLFNGWYLNGELITRSLEYTFSASKYENKYVAVFSDKLYEYEEKDNGICITRYSGNEESIIIPNEIDGKKVIEIGENVFSNCSNLSSIKMPMELKVICKKAFYNCHNLQNIELNNCLKIIGSYAFKNCSNLKNIELNDSLEIIESYAFNHCYNLVNVKMSKSLKEIGAHAFFNCKFETIDLPETLEILDSYAFDNCTELKSINLPNSLKYMGDCLFINTKIDYIEIPESVMHITRLTFFDNILNNISVSPNNKNYYDIEGILYKKEGNVLLAYPNGRSDINIIIPKGTETVEGDAFVTTKRTKGREIIFPKSVINYNFSKNISFVPTRETVILTFLNKNVNITNYPQNTQDLDRFKEFKILSFSGGLVEKTVPSKYFVSLDISEIKLSDKNININIGNDEKLNLEIIPVNTGYFDNTYMKYDYDILKWKSDNEDIVSVDEEGYIFAKNIGTAVITVSTEDGTKTSSCTVTVHGMDSDKSNISVQGEEQFIQGKESSLIANVVGGSGNYEYKFLEKDGNKWSIIQDYSSNNTAKYTPKSAGSKTIYVDIKDMQTGEKIRKYLVIKVEYDELQVESFTASPEDKQIVGEEVQLSAQGTGGSGNYQYKFLEKDGKGNWTKIRDYESENTATYIPTSVGKKTLYVDVKDTKTGQVMRKSLIYDVEYSDVEVESLVVSPEKYQVLGEEIELTANVIGGSGNFEYKFIEKDNQGNWIKIRDYEKTNTTKYTPQSIGKTTLYVDVKDLDTKKVVRKYAIFVVCESKFEVTSFKADKESPYTVDDEITLTANATGGSEKYQYKFLVKEGNKWTVIQNYSDKDNCKYVPTTIGSKTLYVDVKDTVTGVVIRKYLLVKAV